MADDPGVAEYQIRAMRRLTTLLRRFRLRDPVIRGRLAARRRRRAVFERVGSDRYSHPALHSIDDTLDRTINRRGGVFVEAGAHDGFTQSNTYFLERFRSWRGILVEPMPELAAEARRNRPLATVYQCALVAPERAGMVVEMDFGDLMSGIRGTLDADRIQAGLLLGWHEHRVERVEARTLSEILDEACAPPIDLLSLDVEGHEADVLRGLDLSRHAPDWIIVEMHDLQSGRLAIGSVLGEMYREHSQISPLDILYRRV
jgi:FkbM family methyltransferase